MSQVPKKTEARKAKFKELVDPSNEKGKEIYTESSLPLDHNIKVNGIKRENCTVFRSALFPVKYAFTVTEETQQYNTKEDKDTFEVMFKYGDDLRQDQLILQIINYMDSILQKVHLDYEFTTYKVLFRSKKVCFTPKLWYNYFQRSGSIMAELKSSASLDKLEALLQRYHYFKERKEMELAELTLVEYLEYVKYLYRRNKSKAFRKELRKRYRQEAGRLKGASYIRIPKKIALIIWSVVPY